MCLTLKLKITSHANYRTIYSLLFKQIISRNAFKLNADESNADESNAFITNI